MTPTQQDYDTALKAIITQTQQLLREAQEQLELAHQVAQNYPSPDLANLQSALWMVTAANARLDKIPTDN